MNQTICIDAFIFALAGARAGFDPLPWRVPSVPRLRSSLDGQSAVLGMALLLVILRAWLAAWSVEWWSVGNVQVMEGLYMGLARVAVLAADIMAGTAHAGAAVSCGVMAYGVGATTSPTLVGLVAQAFGFPAAFIALLANAAIGLRVWIVRLLLHEHAHDGDQREMPYAKSTG